MTANPHASRRNPELIKRYGSGYSRRLYNTATLSYVTLDDLGEMALQGGRFIVRDAETGEDLTPKVLASLH